MESQEFSPEQASEFNDAFQTGMGLLAGVIENPRAARGLLGFFERKNCEKAVALFDRCLTINSGSWPAMWGQGKAHQALDQHPAALDWFEKALSLSKDNPDVPREACLEAMYLGIRIKAENFAREALKRNPKDPGLFSNLALALILCRELDRAIETAEKALKMAPDDNVCETVLRYAKDIKSGKVPQPDKIGPTLD